jgi:periplasmic copper chaperone A
MLRWIAILAVMVPLQAGAHEIVVGDLHIRHPYVIEPTERLPGELVVSMNIRNDGAADRLLAARSPFAAGAVVAAPIVLPPGQATTIGGTGATLVLKGLTEPLAGYAYFPMTLVFEKAGVVNIEVYVEDATEAAEAAAAAN